MSSKQTTNQRYGLNSIKAKLIIIMTLLCVIPLTIAIIISYNFSTSTALESAENYNLKMAEYVENDFSSTVDSNFIALYTLAQSPSTIAYCEAAADARDQEKMVAHTQAVDANLADDNSTVITGPDGMQLARSKGDLVDISSREYFTTAMKGVSNISDVSVSKTTGARIIVPAVPIFDSTGSNVIGVATRNYALSYLHDHLLEEAKEHQSIYILDPNGDAVSTSTKVLAADETLSMASTECYKSSSSGNLEGSFEEEIDGVKCITSFVKETDTGWTIMVATEYNSIMASATRSALIVLIIGIVMAILAVIIAFVVGNSISKPIEVINESITSLSEGYFKTINVYTNRKDEFGNMVTHTNNLVRKLKEIVSDIKQSATNLNSSSLELADTADQISKTADDVSDAVQEIATGATQQADEIQAATENIQTISSNIENVTMNANDLADTGESMSSKSKSSEQELQQLQRSTAAMNEAISKITERISATNVAVDNIASKVEAIDSISSQTSLLALNASIEAARAGEAGRGFAVVAEEIGILAENSAKSTNEIRKEMDILLADSREAVRMADEIGQTTKSQMSTLENTVESIHNLIYGIDTTVNGVTTINSSAEACNDSRSVVVDSMNSLSAISEENAAASQETSASMQELNATVNILASSADSLKGISETLIEDIAFFKE
ncbi:MAG: methyl-accepting chemotaxis protein [Lachnospiraceae bacterium]|nr:methyl-accepting chemotaxis protein [Lachnospiraceae bacterium]